MTEHGAELWEKWRAIVYIWPEGRLGSVDRYLLPQIELDLLAATKQGGQKTTLTTEFEMGKLDRSLTLQFLSANCISK